MADKQAACGYAPSDMLGTLGLSIAIMGQKLGEAELAVPTSSSGPRCWTSAPPISPSTPAPCCKAKNAALAAYKAAHSRLGLEGQQVDGLGGFESPSEWADQARH